jgi:riboflavin biosynthesis pyrimidine reductase
MGEDAQRSPAGGLEQPAGLHRLQASEEPASAIAIVEGLGLREPTPPQPRPRVLLNMVSTVDGRATLDGRSAPLSSSADRQLFRALRMGADCVLVGAGTVRTERYGRLIHDPGARRARRERGLSEQPLACIVSGRLSLDAEIPLLADPDASVVIVTSSPASVAGARAHVEYVRSSTDGVLDLDASLAQLRARFAVELLLCEGGPHLASQLFAAGLVDELFITISPTLAGGEPSGGEALRILAGPELQPPLALELLGALERDSSLFLRYRVRTS